MKKDHTHLFDIWYKVMQSHPVYKKFLGDMPRDSNGAHILYLAFSYGCRVAQMPERKDLSND